MDVDFQRGLAKGAALGRAAQVIAGIVAFSSILSLISVVVFMNGAWPDALAGTSDLHGIEIVILTDMALFTVSWFIIGAWIYRAHANLLLADVPETKFSPGWAVVCFAMPIAGLFVPFKAMKALWRLSHGLPVNADETAPGLLWLWWIAWIAWIIAFIAAPDGGDFSGLDITVHLATLVSALCMIMIIRQINDAQPTMSIAGTFE